MAPLSRLGGSHSYKYVRVTFKTQVTSDRKQPISLVEIMALSVRSTDKNRCSVIKSVNMLSVWKV
jgi:hypothetical protein